MKRGYSEHHPIVASFKVNSEIQPPQYNKRVPRESHEAPDKIFFKEVEPCKEEEASHSTLSNKKEFSCLITTREL